MFSPRSATYRGREWDTRVGTVELAVPKLRTGSYFPDWLLTYRRRAEQALVSVVATSHLLGVSTRRVEKLVEQLGVAALSKSQVSEMAQHLDATLELPAEALVRLAYGRLDDERAPPVAAIGITVDDLRSVFRGF